MTASLAATGLADGAHFLNIHGKDFAPGVPVNTFPPLPPLPPLPPPPPPPVPPNGDANGDGVVNAAEAKTVIGGVILSLAPHAPGTKAEFIGVNSTGGTLTFNATYNLAQNIYEPGFTSADLLPLDFRVFDMHGGIVPATARPADGITGAPGTFDPDLPTAAGKILAASEPEPMPGVGLLGLAAARPRGLAWAGAAPQAAQACLESLPVRKPPEVCLA